MQRFRECPRGRACASARRFGLLLPPGSAEGGCAAVHGDVSRQDSLCGQDQWRADGAEGAGRGRGKSLRRCLARRIRGGACGLAGCRNALHASGEGAVGHQAGAGKIRHPRDCRRPRGRDHQGDARGAGARHRSRLDDGVRARPDQGGGGLRIVEEVRRRAGPCGRTLPAAARIGYRVGLCFHVGSQIEDPDTYERALASVDWVRNRIGFPLAELDVGGGFPAEYGLDPNSKKPEMPSIGQIMSRLRGDIEE